MVANALVQAVWLARGAGVSPEDDGRLPPAGGGLRALVSRHGRGRGGILARPRFAALPRWGLRPSAALAAVVGWSGDGARSGRSRAADEEIRRRRGADRRSDGAASLDVRAPTSTASMRRRRDRPTFEPAQLPAALITAGGLRDRGPRASGWRAATTRRSTSCRRGSGATRVRDRRPR